MTVTGQFSAPTARGEIILRLKELSGPIDPELRLSILQENCEFFLDDLAFDPPYEATVGVILRAAEVDQFASFMTSIVELCQNLKAIKSKGDDTIEAIKFDAASELAGRLLRAMEIA